MGFLNPAFAIIQRATSSPSRPASVAIIKESTSELRRSFFTLLYCLEVCGITVSFILSGSIGSVSKLHVLYLSSYASGSARVTRCPSAHVTMYLSPIRQPAPFRLQPKTLASSRPTEGFSAKTKIFPIPVSPPICQGCFTLIYNYCLSACSSSSKSSYCLFTRSANVYLSTTSFIASLSSFHTNNAAQYVFLGHVSASSH